MKAEWCYFPKIRCLLYLWFWSKIDCVYTKLFNMHIINLHLSSAANLCYPNHSIWLIEAIHIYLISLVQRVYCVVKHCMIISYLTIFLLLALICFTMFTFLLRTNLLNFSFLLIRRSHFVLIWLVYGFNWVNHYVWVSLNKVKKQTFAKSISSK